MPCMGELSTHKAGGSGGEAVDGSVTDPSLYRAIRLSAPTDGPDWNYFTALRLTRPLSHTSADSAEKVISQAARLGFGVVCLRVDRLEPIHPAIEPVLRRAAQLGLKLIVDVVRQPGLTVTEQLDIADSWLHAGAAGIEIPTVATAQSASTGIALGDLAALHATFGEDRIRATLVSTGDLATLENHLREDWLEVTRNDCLLHRPWNTGSLAAMLAEFYSLHASIGSSPAWEITSRAISTLAGPAKALAMLALPGSMTVSSEVLPLIPELRHALRYRREFDLGRAALSTVDGASMQSDALIIGDMVVYINSSSQPVRIPTLERPLVSTGFYSDDDGLVLEPYSTTWLDYRQVLRSAA